MTDTPKFEVIDRRKFKAEEEERAASHAPTSETPSQDAVSAPPEPSAGPRLVVNESRPTAAVAEPPAAAAEQEVLPEMPPAAHRYREP